MPTKMEATFYDESVSGSTNSSHQRDGMGGGYGFNPKTLKQTMTLNLNDPKHFRPHLRSKAIDILTSPDVGLLKLASPELERLIIASCNGLTTPTPTQFFCPKNITDEQEGFAEGFVRALAELHYQQHGGMPPAAGQSSDAQPGAATTAAPPTTTGGGDDDMAPASSVSESGIPPYSCTVRAETPEYTNLGTSNFSRANNNSSASAPSAGAERHHSNTSYPAVPGTGVVPSQQSQSHAMDPLLQQQRAPPRQQQHPIPHHHHHHHHPHAFKEEPQTVPEMSGDTPPLSPIDMESQERIKAERKRMRNRVAASKCRKRKLERISRLEDRVKNLKTQHTELVSSANVLRDELALLKQKVMDHVNSGCQLILTQQLQAY